MQSADGNLAPPVQRHQMHRHRVQTHRLASAWHLWNVERKKKNP